MINVPFTFFVASLLQMLKSIFFFAVLLVSSLCFASAEISFFLQPHESQGTDCTFEKTSQPHGYLVTCGKRSFRVHHFVRLHSNLIQKQWEVLFWVTNIQDEDHNKHVGTTLWVKADTNSLVNTFKLSQAIDNDTATLDLTINWNNSWK